MISPVELVLRLAVAAVLGALVGLERERLEWAAGMRTHALAVELRRRIIHVGGREVLQRVAEQGR